MSEHRIPQWHPIEALPMIGQALDGMVESAEEVVQSLEQARPRPHVLDDSTIGRVREAHGTQLNDLWWYTEQLARWQRASPTPTQAQELARLTQQLAALHRVLTASLALAEELGVCVAMERKPGKCMLPLPPLPSHDQQPPVLLAA